jgi:chemotaxis protein CheZ
MQNTNDKQLALDAILKEIEEIYKSLKDIQSEASGILHESNVPDSSAQLNDVLESTEKATNVILDSATEINALADIHCSSDEGKNKISDIVVKIYEACNFQDLTGQRIKKVLKNLSIIEDRLAKLASVAKGSEENSQPTQKPVSAKDKDASLMNGPQLTGAAPTQDEIDALFSAKK